MLCGALARLGQMEEHTLLVVVAALHLVGVHHHGGHAGDQVDALVQDIFQAQVLGVLVVGIQAQHTTLQLIHNVGGGGIHGIHKALRQSAMLGQDLAEIIQLLPGRQTAEQQQPDHFLKHETVVAVGLLHDLVDVDAAVDQLARGGDHMSFLILFVAHNVTHVGQAGQHAGAVRVAQTALDAQTLTGLGVDVVVGNVLLAQGPHRGGVQGRHFCMCKIHGGSLLSSGSYFLLSHTFPAILTDGHNLILSLLCSKFKRNVFTSHRPVPNDFHFCGQRFFARFCRQVFLYWRQNLFHAAREIPL